jgi:acetyl-CoA carboxylase carboxyltransferase component
MAVHGAEITRAQAAGTPLPDAVKESVAEMRADYEHQLDARYAAARGFVDAIVTAEETRDMVAFLLQVTSRYPGPHLGPFVLPPLDTVSPHIS